VYVDDLFIKNTNSGSGVSNQMIALCKLLIQQGNRKCEQ
jgi:hypothetical protein